MSATPTPPLIVFEDDHLLVVNKPAGWNTHAPTPFAGEGVYDWLRHREPRWVGLAIIHRLDKETSGLLVFGKTSLANRALIRQFASREVKKKYLLLTDRDVKRSPLSVASSLVRCGEKYASRPASARGQRAETRFRILRTAPHQTFLEAEPITGRTHQIRVHAAEMGFPILGDTLYGGTPALRVFLHAEELELKHPATTQTLSFHAPARFDDDPRLALRQSIIEPTESTAFRLIHGAADGWPGWYVDQLGDFLLSQAAEPLSAKQRARLHELFTANTTQAIQHGIYHKRLTRQVRKTSVAEASAQQAFGQAAPDRFIVLENGMRFELSLVEGYSPGLFLDQRDNRRRILVNHVGAQFTLFDLPTAGPAVLNTFAYTCAFSVCAAKAGALTTNLDLSKKYLDWGRRNFTLNGLDPAKHDFLYGDAFDWLRRLARKGRKFDLILLDPPTFSQSKERGVFRAEKDFAKLVAGSLPLLTANGVLFASSNATALSPEDFLRMIESAVVRAGRVIRQRHYVPQPPDFPISRFEPAYLKTVWLRVS